MPWCYTSSSCSTVIAELEALKRSQKGLGLSEKNRDGKIGSESPVSVVSGFHRILINSTLVFFFLEKCCRMIDDLWESCISQFHKNLRVSSMIDIHCRQRDSADVDYYRLSSIPSCTARN